MGSLSARDWRAASEPSGSATRRGTYHFVAIFVLVAGIAGSVVSGLAWSSHIRSEAAHQFRQSARDVADALTISLQRDAGLTSSASMLLKSTPHLTNAEFTTWFQRLHRTTKYPGSFGLIYIENVSQARLAAFESTVTSDPPFGLPSSTRFALTPPSSASSYCLTRAGVVQVTRGLDLSVATVTSLVGLAKPSLNYCALPIGRLLRRSEASGQPAAANLATLVASMPDPRAHGVTPALVNTVRGARLVTTITPVYATAKPSTAVARTAELSGWVLGVFQAQSILGPTLSGHLTWSATLWYTNPSAARVKLVGGAPTTGDLTQTFTLAGPGAWAVTLAEPSSKVGGSADTQGLVVLFGGLLIAVLLFLLIHLPDRARVRAIHLVAERTDQLHHQAMHDQLTDLPNRELVFDRLEQMLIRARRGMTEVSVLFIDLDQFKDVNDTFGHAAGDHLLQQVGERLRAKLRPSDTVGRIGGDEFVVLLEDSVHAADPEALARRLIDALREKPFVLGASSRTVRVQSASIGIASGIRDSADQLIGDADVALYVAKAERVGQYVLFRPEMREAIASRVALDSELKKAIAGHEFFLVYQPIFNLSSGTVVGLEALLRWRHPVHGVILPGEFIGSLESMGAIVEVGNLVLRDACRQAAAWRQAGHTIYVSVNASALQFDSPGFIDTVNAALDEVGLPPGALMIEITETCVMRDSDQTVLRLKALREIGVRLAIDDFGTGYCSLSYLQLFPVHALKIDRSFVAKLDESSFSQQLIHTIVELAASLQMETVAEGVETDAQLRSLIDEHCVAAQGHLLARPLDAGAATDLLTLGIQLGSIGAPPLALPGWAAPG